MGYTLYIAATMFVAPMVSALAEFFMRKARDRFFTLCLKWFIFWAIGIRLLTAGSNQIFNPAFTAGILQMNASAHVIIRELGFANFLMGALAVLSLPVKSLRLAATLGGLYMGMAGMQHIARGIEHVNLKEATALVSDLWAFVVVVAYYLDAAWARRSSITS